MKTITDYVTVNQSTAHPHTETGWKHVLSTKLKLIIQMEQFTIWGPRMAKIPSITYSNIQVLSYSMSHRL